MNEIASNENELMPSLLVRDDVGNAVATSTVAIPPANSVETENPTLSPREGMCNWCRRKNGDIFLEQWPICFDCIETLIERENSLLWADQHGFGRMWRRKDIFEALTPWGWEKD